MSFNSKSLLFFEQILAIFALISELFICQVYARWGGVELHAHLFMKEGMSWSFNGSFNGPLKATSWKDGLSSQANPETLEKSELDIVVVSLYANPIFTLSMRDSIRRQVNLTRQFTQENPQWVLASTPAEAKAALDRGNHVLILSLEGASGILENEDDIKEFVDQDGIRIVTLLHLTDDEFGGVAFLDGMRALASPIAFLNSLMHPVKDLEGNRLNAHGLTERGRQFTNSLIQHRVWIDLAHASDQSQQDLRPILEKAGQPLLYTHTALRQYHHAERGITIEQLQRVAKTGGFVGLMPSEYMIGNTVTQSECNGSVQALAVQFKELTKILGSDAVSLGSDFNGGINHLKPSCNTGTQIDREGFWNIGQMPELWRALETMGAVHHSPFENGQTRNFLTTWAKLWNLRL